MILQRDQTEAAQIKPTLSCEMANNNTEITKLQKLQGDSGTLKALTP